MLYDRQKLQAFAMQAETASQLSDVEKTGGWIEIASVGNALGLTQQDSLSCATFLKEMGWAKVEFTNPPKMFLLPKGYEEIAKLRMTPWRRWWENHGDVVIAGTIASILGSAIVLIVSFLVRG